ncbi:MAG: Uma2 family endonuclease [Cyanobacteria bacterium SBLK]|nr:Uma2 family endonuclease [Cyanobacteria bacterium SBLK]
MSLEDFLNYDDGTDTLYELEDGRLRVMTVESELNRLITSFLFAYFLQSGIPFSQLTMKTEVAVSGMRTTVRLPDLLVLTEELVTAMAGSRRSLITLEMPPPQLAIEVVSPGRENTERDYRYKRSQYQARGISEYWIVDPIQQQITVLSLIAGLYEEAILRGEEGIASPLLEELGGTLTVMQILAQS